MQPGIVQVTAIHDVKSTGFRNQMVEHIDVVQLSVADMNEGWNASSQVQEGMKLDGGLALAEVGPRKHRKTKIDSGGIECIHSLVEFDSEIVVDVETSSSMDKRLSKVGINAPVAYLVGVGQGVSRNLSANAHMIKLALLSTKTSLDVAQAFAICELGKGHA